MFQSPQMTISRPDLIERFEVGEEDVHEAEFGLLALVAAGAGRLVERDDGELAVVGLDVAALGVEFGHAETFDDLLRLAWRV